MRNYLLGGIFFLFIACFVAIVIEETFLGGRRRRRLEKQARLRNESDKVGDAKSGDT